MLPDREVKNSQTAGLPVLTLQLFITRLGTAHLPRLEFNATIAGVEVFAWRRWLVPSDIILAAVVIIHVD
jgi:hypothetical protein